MANVLINEDTMTDIADAIRAKKGVSTKYKPSEMPSAIDSISGGGGGDNPNHMELHKELVIECGGATVLSNTNIPAYQLTGSTAPIARRSLYSVKDGVHPNCYYVTSGTGTISGVSLIEIPTGATAVSITVDKACQYTVRDYVISNGSVVSSAASSAWMDLPANTPTNAPFTSGSTHLTFVFRVDASNTAYSASNMLEAISLDFS